MEKITEIVKDTPLDKEGQTQQNNLDDFFETIQIKFNSNEYLTSNNPKNLALVIENFINIENEGLVYLKNTVDEFYLEKSKVLFFDFLRIKFYSIKSIFIQLEIEINCCSILDKCSNNIIKIIENNDLKIFTKEIEEIKELTLKGIEFKDLKKIIDLIIDHFISLFINDLFDHFKIENIPLFISYMEIIKIKEKVIEQIYKVGDLMALKISSIMCSDSYSRLETHLNIISNQSTRKLFRINPKDTEIKSILNNLLIICIFSNYNEFLNEKADLFTSKFSEKAQIFIKKLINTEREYFKNNEFDNQEIFEVRIKLELNDSLYKIKQYILKKQLQEKQELIKLIESFLVSFYYLFMNEDMKVSATIRKIVINTIKFLHQNFILDVLDTDFQTLITKIEILFSHNYYIKFEGNNNYRELITKFLNIQFKHMEKLINNSSNNIKQRFNNFVSDNIKRISEKKEKKDKVDKVVNTLFSFGKQLMKNFSANKDEFLDIDSNKIYMTRYSDTKVIFPTVTILLSGFLSQDESQEKLWKNVLDKKNLNSEFYTFHWPSSSHIDLGINISARLASFTIDKIFNKKKQLADEINAFKLEENEFLQAKKRSKIIGKLLAQFLLTNSFFKSKLINLVGFSLGSSVIKHCLKEMSYISNSQVIINDVVFIAGATCIDLNTEKTFNCISQINGRFINVFSKYDIILNQVYREVTNKNPVGLHKLEYTQNDKLKRLIYSKLENFDFSEDYIGHTDYRAIMGVVFDKIKFMQN